MNKYVPFGIILLFLLSSLIPTISSYASEENRTIYVDDGGADYTKIHYKIENGSLSGFVNDSFFNPIEGALVSIKCGGLHMQNTSDSTGLYYIDNVPIVDCYWNVSASKKWYETFWVEMSIDINSTYDFVLTPLGKTLYVGGSGPGNYTEIQDAIDAASDGDTIFVFNGTYYENLFLNKSVSLIGEDKDSTIMDGNWCETVIRISSVIKNEVMIKGFTIRHGEEYGISSFGNLKVNIIGNNIMDNYGDGIYLDKVDRCNISDNVIEKNSDGIYLYGSGATNITNNIITDNYGGIHLYQSFNTKIIDNTVSDNLNSGVLLTSCYDIVLEDNSIIYNYEGVYLYNCVVCNVSSNIISYSNGKGLTIASGYNNVVYNNTCSKNIMGITISDSEFNSIVYNTLKDNFGYKVKGLQFDGIGLYESCRLNQIYHNNLINDDIRFAEYTPYANSIMYNYYDGWMGAIPKPISGFKVVIISSDLELPIRWIKFDWHPAKEPYGI